MIPNHSKSSQIHSNVPKHTQTYPNIPGSAHAARNGRAEGGVLLPLDPNRLMVPMTDHDSYVILKQSGA